MTYNCDNCELPGLAGFLVRKSSIWFHSVFVKNHDFKATVFNENT